MKFFLELIYFFSDNKCRESNRENLQTNLYIALPDDELTLSQFKNHLVPID